MTVLAESVVQSVKGCARCHSEGHEDLEFKPLTYPIEVGIVRAGNSKIVIDVQATHWAPCPINGEPILLSFVQSPTICER